MDRLDMVIEVHSITDVIINQTREAGSETSANIRERVCNTFKQQLKRNGCANSALKTNDIEQYCELTESDKSLLQTATRKLALSGRAIHRIIKVARTIADLSSSEHIKAQHLTEAMSYRKKINQSNSLI
jgi:magnesium chelatase family protein